MRTRLQVGSQPTASRLHFADPNLTITSRDFSLPRFWALGNTLRLHDPFIQVPQPSESLACSTMLAQLLSFIV